MTQPPSENTQLTLFDADRHQMVPAGEAAESERAELVEISASAVREMTPREKFDWFHKHNPHVYRALVDLARQRKNRGRKHWSMKAAFEVLRDLDSFQTDPRSETSKYKLNNIFTAFYARLIMQNEPDLAGFFSTRGDGETDE